MIKKTSWILISITFFLTFPLSSQSRIEMSLNGGVNSGTVYLFPNTGPFYSFSGVYQGGLKYGFDVFEKITIFAGLDLSFKSRHFHNYDNTYISSPLTQSSYDYLALICYKTSEVTELRFGGYFQNVIKSEEYNNTEQALGLRFQFNYSILDRFNTGVVIYSDVSPSRVDLGLDTHHMYNYGAMFELEYKLFEFKRK